MPRKYLNSSKEEPKILSNPGKTPEENENNMIALAIAEAERRIIDHTASSQIICHYLKLGSTKERLEKEILEKQKELYEAKTEALKSAKRMEELYAEAIKAMRVYQGTDEPEEEDEY